MEILRADFYYFVFVFTALYSLAFFFFLSGRLQYSPASRGFALFLGCVFFWALKDSLAAAFFSYLDTRSLLDLVVALSPLYLFVPLVSFHMLITVYNAAAPAGGRFKEVRLVEYLLAGIAAMVFVISMVDHTFMYRNFAKGVFDYHYEPGISFYIFFSEMVIVNLVPAVLLLRAAVVHKKQEALYIGLGSLMALAVIFPTNIMPSFMGLHGFPRLGCLSVFILSAFAFYGILRHGELFRFEKVIAERDLFEKIGVSLKDLINLSNEEEIYQNICDYSRDISESVLVAIVTFGADGSQYEVRALSRITTEVAALASPLPLILHRSYPMADDAVLRRQVTCASPLRMSSAEELFGRGGAPAAATAGHRPAVRQIISYPIIYEDTIKGAVLFFRTNQTSDLNLFSMFSLQCSLVMKFGSQIRELEEKRKLAEQLRQSQKMEAIGLLAGGIAHDFNNLLSGVSGFAQLIKRRFAKDNPEMMKLVDPILDAAARGSSLTKQLLAFARKGKYQQVNFDLHDVIERTMALLRRTIDKRIQISRDLRALEPVIMGDPSQIENALLNLALNARDAMPEGGDLVFHTERVTIGADEVVSISGKYHINPGTFILISVVDTGMGMNEETKTRLFEPFFTTKEVGKGTGLGLASVYGCIKNHNGYIEVDSSVGQGTTVRIYFPAALGPAETPARTEEKTGPVVKGKGHILVIDDEDIVRSIIREMLSDLGYSVALCGNGEDAIEYYRRHQPEIDLVIIDMIMPKMGGFDCLRHLKKFNPDIKAIISTGYSMAEDTQQIMTWGIAGFIQKPFDAGELSKAISDALRR
jgi:signal transduction histidine kinase/uncharacterized membrane protein